MLTGTFCHISGIREQTEQKLWSAGVTSWDSPLPRTAIRLSRLLQQSWPGHMQESVGHFQNRNADYFAGKLPAAQQWRLYRDFKDSCAFIDIETTGMLGSDQITTIALYDGRSVRHYVRGDNLDDFRKDVQAYSVLVTYNGKSFDVPFLERHFGIRLPLAHIDLMHPLRSLGIKGGLKGCERQVGIARPGLEDVDGFLAVLLWNDYQKRKNVKALETLLAYNIQDAISLHVLMVHAHNEKIKATPFAGSSFLPYPVLPEVSFKPDPDTVNRILRQANGAAYLRPAFSSSWR